MSGSSTESTEEGVNSGVRAAWKDVLRPESLELVVKNAVRAAWDDALRRITQYNSYSADAFVKAFLGNYRVDEMLTEVKKTHVKAAAAQSAPHVLMRPTVERDGGQWVVAYNPSKDLKFAEAVVGVGESPAEACAAFDRAWHAKTSQEQDQGVTKK